MATPYPFPDSHTPVGSGIYYAIRFAPQQQRSGLSLANALYRSIVDIPDQCTEPAVAAEKLRWWRQELHLAFNQPSEAQHPVSAAAALLVRQHGMDEASFAPLFQVTGQMIGGMELADEAALERYLDATGALFGELLATVAGAETGQLLHARALGRFLAEASTISAIGGDVRQNRLLLPVSRLHSFGLNSGDLLGERAAGLGPLLSDAIARARKHHQENLQALSPTAVLGPLLSLAALADHLLALAERDGVEKLLRQRFELTPLRKLWICWRCQKGLR